MTKRQYLKLKKYLNRRINVTKKDLKINKSEHSNMIFYYNNNIERIQRIIRNLNYIYRDRRGINE